MAKKNYVVVIGHEEQRAGSVYVVNTRLKP